MRKAILALGMIVFLGGLLAWQGAAIPPLTEQTSADIPEASKQQVLATYGKLPLSFEANQGQTDEQVKFLSRGGGYTLFLTSTEAVLVLRKAEAPPPQHATDAMPRTMEPEAAEATPPAVLRMKLVGSNPAPQVEGVDELPGRSNYFIGNDPKKWRTNVAHYRKAKLQNVYPGIDLVYYGTNQRQLEYDFIVAPGADPKAITLNFEGADNLEVDAQGDLLVHLGDEELRFQKPYVYQENSGARQEIAGSYVLKGKNEVAFEVSPYDASQPLIIDPVLSYSTYLGGSGSVAINESGESIAVDDSGNAYVTGQASSSDFPTTPGAFQPTGGGDAFVTKLNPTGSALVYSTYLGGSGGDFGRGIAVDSAGNAYVTGSTGSPDFPTANAFQSSCRSCPNRLDVFVTKLHPTGSSIVYSTFLGGGQGNFGNAVAVDSAGNAYVTGRTLSNNFPTANPLQGSKASGFLVTDAFVTKFNTAGSALVYSTYFGGPGNDEGRGIAVDASGNAYITGRTGSLNFPVTPGAFQPAHGGGSNDVFIAKFNAAGSTVIYSTFLGGSSGDLGNDIAVDDSGNAYVAGQAGSSNFPTTPGAFQPTGGGDAFVTKLNPTGSALVYSTYIGGNGADRAFGVAVDASGNAYVTGDTLSLDFPTVNPLQPTGGGDAFVTKLNPTGSALVYSTYLGGSGFDTGAAVAVDASGNAYVTGATKSANFPTANPFQAACSLDFFGRCGDAFVTKIGPAIEVTIDIKPGNGPNAVNPAANGLTPVAILTTETFDATTVSPITVQFGPAGASIAHQLGHLEDVDNDGDLDLVLHFRTQEAGIQCGDTEASLTGETFDGQAIQGSDSIVTVGCS